LPQNNDELISLKELLNVGWLQNTDEQLIFEDNGQVLAHYSCALWSDSVDKDDRKNLLYVDKAVCEGLFQVDMLFSFFLSFKC
jgi:hypothetical protein